MKKISKIESFSPELLNKFREELIEKCAKIVENLKSEVDCECDNYCSCSSGMIYSSEAADAIRKLKEK